MFHNIDFTSVDRFNVGIASHNFVFENCTISYAERTQLGILGGLAKYINCTFAPTATAATWNSTGDVEVYGGAWDDQDDISTSNSIFSSSLFIAADSPIGVLLFGVGHVSLSMAALRTSIQGRR